MRKTSRKLLAVILALVVGVLVSACAPREESGNIRLGDIGWDESQAIANLTKILLEEDMGYTVDIQRLESPPLLFQAVGQGEIDAFQDVWLPNHQAFLDEQGDQVQLLDYWYEGETSFGIAVPTYLDVTSLDELNDSNVDTIYGIEPGTPGL
jgi:glycine betaine/proline transport system substrate-binding protein